MATRFPESDASITTWCPYCGKLQRIAKFCCVCGTRWSPTWTCRFEPGALTSLLLSAHADRSDDPPSPGSPLPTKCPECGHIQWQGTHCALCGPGRIPDRPADAAGTKSAATEHPPIGPTTIARVGSAGPKGPTTVGVSTGSLRTFCVLFVGIVLAAAVYTPFFLGLR